MSIASRYRPAAPKPEPRQAQKPKLERGAKELISIRLDPDILAAYRKTGKGWQSKINDDLRKALKL